MADDDKTTMHEVVILTNQPLSDSDVTALTRVLKVSALDRSQPFVHAVIQTGRTHELDLSPSAIAKIYPGMEQPK